MDKLNQAKKTSQRKFKNQINMEQQNKLEKALIPTLFSPVCC